jgi:hypothetical protein
LIVEAVDGVSQWTWGLGGKPVESLEECHGRAAVRAGRLYQVGCSWRHAALCGAWRGQAVPTRGLYQVGSRRHRILQGAWRRQARPARGLPQVGRRRRHAAVQGAWRGQAVASRRAASSQLEAARSVAARMAAAGGARRRAATKGIKTARGSAWRMAAANGARRRAASSPQKEAARLTARRTAIAGAGDAKSRAASSRHKEEARLTSDELTVLYSNGPDDRSFKLALGYVTAATSGC